MTAPETPTPPRRWLTWALAASLALNLLVLGLIGGAILRGPPPRPDSAPGLWHYGSTLPDPYREDLARALRASRDDWIGPREALRAQRGALAEALRAEPFELAAVRSLLEREAELAGELADRGTELLVTQIERMDADDRARYAEALMQPRRHWRRHRR